MDQQQQLEIGKTAVQYVLTMFALPFYAVSLIAKFDTKRRNPRLTALATALYLLFGLPIATAIFYVR